MSDKILLSILIGAPLLGFLFNGIRFRSKNYLLSGSVATAAVATSFVSSILLVSKLIQMNPDSREITVTFFNWLTVGSLDVKASFVIDQISSIMILVITGVGSLIHLFSIGYMSHDERPTKYFAYLNLFLFNMLLLVLGGNLLIMFVGWEGVGLCSYLLIGFWFKDGEKAAAGMKAFITNRIGDAGFLLGIFVLFKTFGTLDFKSLLEILPSAAELTWSGPITLACLFLFIGATGKSAQIPLYVWLPDAMAGPTPVSALIHAATMVTAGVYMMVRLSGLYILAPNAMFVVACVGGLTAVLAATIGMTQWDIKKVLAYSTVSQLGYMVLGVGVGAFMPAMFHLMTHAFFKALMFLGSGSVIHSMHEEQDIRKMGGLKKYMPITHITFFIGWLAIIGIPPFAGFFSKDEILWYAFNKEKIGPFLWLIGLVGAGLTAFYMTRLMALVFWGKSRISPDVHPHESPISMTFPLIVLAILSVIGGWVGIPHVIAAILPGHPHHILGEWLGPVISETTKLNESALLEWALMGISVGIAGTMAWLAYDIYVGDRKRAENFVQRFPKIHHLVFNKYLVDEFYFGKIINPLIEMSRGLWGYIDVNFIDKTTYFVSDVIIHSGRGLKSLQNGKLQHYALLMVMGVVLLMIFAL